jgi:hypothetical protein
VATTGGAIPEVAGPDGETCLAVPPGDPGALAAALGRLLGDPALRARLGSAGRERVLARFTWAKAAEGTVAHYRAAMAHSASRPRPRAAGAGTDGRGGAPDAGSPATPDPDRAEAADTPPAAEELVAANRESRATC